jgi:hypothetical protein
MNSFLSNILVLSLIFWNSMNAIALEEKIVETHIEKVKISKLRTQDDPATPGSEPRMIPWTAESDKKQKIIKSETDPASNPKMIPW